MGGSLGSVSVDMVRMNWKQLYEQKTIDRFTSHRHGIPRKPLQILLIPNDYKGEKISIAVKYCRFIFIYQ